MQDATAVRWGWLRSVRFDGVFIVGVTALALLTGVLVVGQPRLFPIVVFLDLWLLSYHHVIATFTRIAFDRASFREHRFLILVLPVLVVGGTVSAVLVAGPWILPTTYFYWQWLHYTRQSYGISRIYQLKTATHATTRDRLGNGMLYLVAAAGVLHRSSQGWTELLGFPLRMIPVPPLVAQAATALAGAVVLMWLARELRAARAGRIDAAYALYLASHLVIFAVGYFIVPDINSGWLVVNVWHNGQYLLLVWMYNNNRFRTPGAPPRGLLARISQDGYGVIYAVTCLLVTTLFYATLDRALGLFAASTLPLMLIVYQAINFHHYVVDAVIWKVRKKPLRETLGVG
jgi:hypothetical protein